MKRTESPIVVEGFMFILPLCLVTAVVAWMKYVGLTIIGLAVTGFVINFFRNPERKIPDDSSAVLSPADGRVLQIEEIDMNDILTGTCKKVSIFMNVFNVHVNRIPCSGTVKHIVYEKGKFFNASLDKASELNERNSVLLATDDGKEILTIQIAGVIARRIVCWVKKGTNITRGERFGLIRFGSRLEVFMPVDTEILVKAGDKVRAGETKIGCLK